MSYKWPDKDPDETVDYSIDWSRFLGSDTVSSATWFVDDADGVKTQAEDNTPINGLGVLFAGTTISSGGKVTTVRLASGTNNVRYRITCQINTTNSLIYERSVFLRIKEK